MPPRSSNPLLHWELTQNVIDAFYETYNELGTGFQEFICRKALALVLRTNGLNAIEEAEIPVCFRNHWLATFKADIVVNNLVLVEVKAVKELEPWHEGQVLSYLKGSTFEVGLLLNFGPQAKAKRFAYSNDRKRGGEPTNDEPSVTVAGEVVPEPAGRSEALRRVRFPPR
jgi:GxxExxY protein